MRRGLGKLLSVSRGTHIVVEQEFLSRDGKGQASAIMVPKTEDGRIIFAIPWLGKVVIGTTDLPAAKVEMEPGHEVSEIEFLMETINPFLTRAITRDDILSVFSGLRPLVTGNQANTAKLSREHHIDISSTGLITVAGGKWTTYRHMAEDTLDFAIKHGVLPAKACVSKLIRMRGAPTIAEAKLQRSHPLARYGTDAAAIQRIAQEDATLAHPIDRAFAYTGAEVVYAVREELGAHGLKMCCRAGPARCCWMHVRLSGRLPGWLRSWRRELGYDQEWIDAEVARFKQLSRHFYGVAGEVCATCNAARLKEQGSGEHEVAEDQSKRIAAEDSGTVRGMGCWVQRLAFGSGRVAAVLFSCGVCSTVTSPSGQCSERP